MMDYTNIVRRRLVSGVCRMDRWGEQSEEIQRGQLGALLRMAGDTEVGRRYGFDSLRSYADFARTLPEVEYEDIRSDVMRMIHGEKNVLWPGRCRYFAQSSGTSGGPSKYIPVTSDSLHLNHLAGAAFSVGSYLRLRPESRLFSGKNLVLGGSFANTLGSEAGHARVGDLSACLISRTPMLASLFRTPPRHIALMPDWEQKLPAIVEATARENVTGLSGVPSWMLAVLRGVLELRGTGRIADVWPDMEVFFHGGIAFGPYRRRYDEIFAGCDMHYIENYNASEGFFAAQTDFADPAMTLLIDAGVFYEFKDTDTGRIMPLWEVEEGHTYALYITGVNGLWRYAIGDTVRIEHLHPLRITIAGRTRSFINAFGEELMEQNAETAIAEACAATGASAADYTAAPVYAAADTPGRHQWLIEWEGEAPDIEAFRRELDSSLRRINSDYAAKRGAGGIFMSEPEIVSLPRGTFARWLETTGSRRLGGQRKVPRLRNDRSIADSILALISH